jgi:hypothetical protein
VGVAVEPSPDGEPAWRPGQDAQAARPTFVGTVNGQERPATAGDAPAPGRDQAQPAEPVEAIAGTAEP